MRKRRKSLGLKAEVVAVKADVSPNHYYTLEQAKHVPDDATLRRIAKVLRCRPEWLRTGEEPVSAEVGK